VLHGLTTAFLLEAIAQNGSGRLTSIDLPSYRGEVANKDGIDAFLPAGKKPGWVVGGRLRQHWELKEGASSDVLPRLGDGQIDFFLHDSDHTYATMRDEIDWAWARLNPGGFLAVDNIDYSRAFFDFCRKVDKAPFVLSAPNLNPHAGVRFALLRKP
jgi:predicted O-methyltransferase YrrM